MMLSPASGTHDVIVIGAGIVGCAIARAFALAGAGVLVLEKAADVLDGASKANSAILHTGFDAPPGSLEAACIAAGHAEYLEIHARLGLPLLRAGALVIAWTEEEEARLPALMAQAAANGVTDVEPLDAAGLAMVEPALAQGARGGFRVPREYLIDPWSAAHAYLGQALANGATLMRSAGVTGGFFDGALWHIETTKGPVHARMVINAAGLYGDLLDKALLGRCSFTIRPRKGQFILFDKPAAALAGHILLPVPSKTTKGIVICRTAFGNLLVGPTAEEQEDRTAAVLVPETLAALRRRGEEIIPALARHEVTAVYAGLRPATEAKEYRIASHADRRYISVGGIRSTGLSAALGIGRHVLDLASSCATWQPPARPAWPAVPNISEALPRDWEMEGNGGIICHCERVTRREIAAALEGPMAAASLAGLKRRTRVTMGRCQGFYCTPALAEITAKCFACPLVEPIDG